MIDLAVFLLAVVIFVGMTAYFFVKADDAEKKEFEHESEVFNRYFELFKDKSKE